jgi:hypothetical protein
MAKFLNRPLPDLDRIYDVQGNIIRTDQLDLSGVQLVHDVSRGAARAISRQLTNVLRAQLAVSNPVDPEGVAVLNDQVAIGAGAQGNLDFDIWSFAVLSDLNVDQVDIWCTEVRLSCAGVSGSDPEGPVAIVRRSSDVGTNQSNNTVLYRINGRYFQAPLPPNEVPLDLQLRERLPRQLHRSENGTDTVSVAIRSNTSADTYYGQADFIVTPRGITPDWIVHG